MTKELDRRIEEARAAKARTDARDADRQLAAELPQLLAQRARQQAEDARRQRLAETMDQAREMLNQAAQDTKAWHSRLITLCQDIDGATLETAGDLRAELVQHMDSLLDLQAPILAARAEVQRLAGAGFEQLWTEAGGYNPDLSPDPDRALVGHSHREALKRRLRGRAIYRPKPLPTQGGL